MTDQTIIDKMTCAHTTGELIRTNSPSVSALANEIWSKTPSEVKKYKTSDMARALQVLVDDPDAFVTAISWALHNNSNILMDIQVLAPAVIDALVSVLKEEI